MNLHVDLETLQLIQGPGQRSAVASLRFKRGDAVPLQVTFLENGVTPVTIGEPEALEIQIGVKPRSRYDAGYLVHDSAWTMPEDGTPSPAYHCTPNFNTLELDAALGIGSDNELSELTMMGEITWRVADGLPTSTRTFWVVVENDVNRGTEGVPTSANPPYPAPQDIALVSDIPAFPGDVGAAPAVHNHNGLIYPETVKVVGGLFDGNLQSVRFPCLVRDVSISGDYQGYSNGTNRIYPVQTGDYFVKWVMTSSSNNSWESTADVPCPTMVPAAPWHATQNPHGWKPVMPASGTPSVVLAGVDAASIQTALNGEPVLYDDLGPVVISDPTGIAGAQAITNIVRISQTNYNAINTPAPNVTYIVIPD